MITIIFENKNILVIDKPAGLVVHPASPPALSADRSIASWAVEKYPDMAGVGEPFILSDGEQIDRPGIVHRLDRETSGVMVLAKTQASFEHLKQQFKDRLVSKTYHAFVYERFTEEKGVVDRPIGKSRKDFRQWSAQRGARGVMRDAVTEYKVLAMNKEASYIELRPQTGRTHQIRVHMKAVNHPVVCDKLYAPKRECLFGFERLALHAKEIRIIDEAGETRVFEAPLPSDFNQALEFFS